MRKHTKIKCKLHHVAEKSTENNHTFFTIFSFSSDYNFKIKFCSLFLKIHCLDSFWKKIWFIYIFVQRACSLDLFSILKGKCDADIMQKRTKGKSFVENSAKKVFWSSYTFVQIAFSQDFIRILEENCGGNINDRRPRFNSFVENTAKKVFWFRYTFVERPRSLHFLRVLQENCGVECRHE